MFYITRKNEHELVCVYVCWHLSLQEIFVRESNCINKHESLRSTNRHLLLENMNRLFEAFGEGVKLMALLATTFFETFGVPEQLTSNGGPQFNAGVTVYQLAYWGVY